MCLLGGERPQPILAVAGGLALTAWLGLSCCHCFLDCSGLKNVPLQRREQCTSPTST